MTRSTGDSEGERLIADESLKSKGDGTPIGGVPHQFRDTAEGIHARLLVEFPLPMLTSIVHGHRWHLACEFSNTLEAAAAADRT